MAGDPDKVRAAYEAWIEVNKECMELWLQVAMGKRMPDQSLMLEMTEKGRRLYAAFVEASSSFGSFPKP